MKHIPKLYALIEDRDARRLLAKSVAAALVKLGKPGTCNHDYVWQIATGRRQASPILARAIETATKGKVTRYDLREDVFGKK